MEALLKKQNEILSSLDSKAKLDTLIQAAQLFESKRIDDDGDRVESQLQDLNKNVKKLNDKTGDNLNSNVIKLTAQLRKVALGDSVKGEQLDSKVLPFPSIQSSKAISTPVNTTEIIENVKGRRRYNETQNVKDDLKDLFSVRGFLDKMNIAPRGESGLLSDFMDKRENRKNWVESRMRVADDPELKQFGGDEGKVKEYLTKQHSKKLETEESIFKNEEDIAEQRKRGMSDDQIKRMGLFDKQTELSTNLAKIDPSVRPQTAKDQEQKASENQKQTEEKAAKVLPFTKELSAGSTGLGASLGDESLNDEEAMLEQNRMIAEQTSLLTKIEENTAILKTMKGGMGSAPVAEAAAGGAAGGSLLDMIPTKSIARGARSVGRGLVQGAKAVGGFALRRAGPLAAAASVGAGLYQGYQGYQKAGEQEKSTLENIDAKVESGEISEDQAKGLRVEARETATVDRSSSVGKGGGMAAGGAVGALKGAAVGAAVGSVVPIVGTVIGGAIGAGLGAIGGSYLGGKIGEKAGQFFGSVKNRFFGKSGESDKVKRVEAAEQSNSVDIQFSELDFRKADPENAKKFRLYRDELTKKYADEQAKKFKRKDPSQLDISVARAKANTESILKFRSEIEAAGAGKVTGGKKEEPAKLPGEKTAEALQKTAEGVTGKPPEATSKITKNADGSTTIKETESYDLVANERVVPGQPLSEKQMNIIGISKSMGNKYPDYIEKQYESQTAAKLKPPEPQQAPNTGDIISKQSSDVESARMAANKPTGDNNIVNAPVVNNNTNKTTQSFRSNPRTQENSVTRYLDKRYA